MPDPEHDWQNCEICYLMVLRYGESYFDPKTGWHPRPTQVIPLKGGGWGIISVFETVEGGGQDNLDNLHRLKDGEVISCWSLN
jgi:hypothetical protein